METLPLETIANTWIKKAIEDLYTEFIIGSIFPSSSPFYFFRALEKILKTYIICENYDQLSHTNRDKSKLVIDSIARQHGHHIKKMALNLLEKGIIEDSTMNNEYYFCSEIKISGIEILSILEKSYLESHYPVPKMIYKDYPSLKYKKIYHDVSLSSTIDHFTYKLSAELITKIEEKFNIAISKNKISTAINDDDWLRFYRLFYKKYFNNQN